MTVLDTIFRKVPDTGDTTMETWRFRVYGRVQGVGYRANCMDMALALGLRGWVRNRADGSVEALAAGPVDQLERLREWMRRGPPAADVLRLEVDSAALEVESFESFDWRPTE